MVIFPTEALHGDRYTYITGKCDDPAGVTSKSLWHHVYDNVTLMGCEYMCSGIYNNSCSTIVYDRKRLTCTMMSNQEWPIPRGFACVDTPHIEWYLRVRNLGKSNMIFLGGISTLYRICNCIQEHKEILLVSYVLCICITLYIYNE